MFTRLLILFLLVQTIDSKSALSKKHSNRIGHLLKITEAEKKFNYVLEKYITNDPTLSMYKKQIMSFIDQFLSFKTLRPNIIKIYGELYTLSDINELIKFYSSSTGKKILEKEIEAEFRLTQLIKTKLQEQSPQITSWFQQMFLTELSKDQLNKTIESFN